MTTTDRATILSASLAAVLGVAACTANPPADARKTAHVAPTPAAPAAPPAPAAPATAPAPAPTPAPAAPTPAPAAPTPETPPASDAPPGAPALPSLADPEPDTDPSAVPSADPSAPTGPAALVAAPIAATEHTVAWRTVVTPAAPVTGGFRYFATGVLAGEAPKFFTLDPTGAWTPAGITGAAWPMSGHWPDEAWAVEFSQLGDRADIGRMRLHRWRGGSRWVPQDLDLDQWVMTDRLGPVRKSWNVGFLAVLDDKLVRVAGNGLADPSLPEVHGHLRDLVESKAGDLFALSKHDEYRVQIACADAACVQTHSTPLPPGSWEWLQSIPRQKHGVSITLRDHPNTNHLLHYETGGWKLEVLPAGPQFAGIWPTSDGGMWAQTETGLLHRDPAGAWRSVALPAGFQPSGPVFAAMTTNMSELVILGVQNGAQSVLATPARAQPAG